MNQHHTGEPGGADDPPPGGVSAQRRALDELVRHAGREHADQDRRPWGRVSTAAWIRPALAVVVALVAIWLWPHLRRPVPADESLPRADATTTVAPAAGDRSSERPGGTVGDPAPDTGDDSEVVVHVVGAVVRPGVLRLPRGSRAIDAVDLAGGLAADADTARVNLAAELVDGQRLVVPVVGQDPPVEVASGGATSGGAASAGGPAGPLELNSATVEQLDELPGVGPSTAAAIVEHRSTVGAFRSVEDLLDVRGIGDAKLDALRDLVVIG